jgi:hypothetical protein
MDRYLDAQRSGIINNGPFEEVNIVCCRQIIVREALGALDERQSPLCNIYDLLVALALAVDAA